MLMQQLLHISISLCVQEKTYRVFIEKSMLYGSTFITMNNQIKFTSYRSTSGEQPIICVCFSGTFEEFKQKILSDVSSEGQGYFTRCNTNPSTTTYYCERYGMTFDNYLILQLPF